MVSKIVACVIFMFLDSKFLVLVDMFDSPFVGILVLMV